MDHYQTLELEPGASLDDIRKSYRNLVLRYHPDRNKDPESTNKFIKINEAYEALCKEKTVTFQSGFDDFLNQSDRVSVGFPDKFSYVEVKQQDKYFHGTLRRSEDVRYSIVFSDGYGDFSDGISKKWINGKVVLIEDQNLLWIKEFERPWNCSVSNNGRVALIYSFNNLSTISSPKEFVDLGCKLVVFDKLGEEIFGHEFGSNSFECAISSDGSRVLVSTLSPDNSIYCFDLNYLQSKGLNSLDPPESEQWKAYWKYKHHSRNGVHKLRFLNGIIEVFTTDTEKSSEREYALYLDGTLLPEYAKEVESITRIKKQRGEEKLQSLMAMVNSEERRKVIEGLFLLASFVNTKGALPHYAIIIRNISKLIDTKDSDLFSVVWKIIKGVMKKKTTAIEPIVSLLLLRIKKLCDDGEQLVYLGELGEHNPDWVMDELPLIKEKLRSNAWNERRLAAFAIGYIGAANFSLVEDTIPQIIEYIANPVKLAKELEQIFERKDKESVQSVGSVTFTITQEKDPMEDATWIRDACIDAIGEIGKNFPKSVEFAVPLLEEVSRNTPSPYTLKKAVRAIDAIHGKCKETCRHAV